MSVRELLQRAESKAVALVGGVAVALHLPAIIAAVGAFWANLGALFGFTSILGFAVAPEVSSIPTAEATAVAVTVGLLYGMKRGIAYARSYWKSYKENLNS